MDDTEEYSIDRFEEDIAVLENRDTGDIINVSREEIPEECEEGDILKFIDGEYFLDKKETERIEDELQDEYGDLWE